MITEYGPATLIMTAAFLVLVVDLCPKVHAEITLASGGQSDYTIIIDQDCSPSERHGAEELQMFLEQICGAKLPIRRIPVSGPMILVGQSKVLDSLPVNIDFEALGQEDFVIRTVGPHLVLAGGRLRGSMYACYEFLDKYLGCRWFTAGGATPAVSRIPRQETIKLPGIDYRKVPVLEYREPFYIEAWDGDWAARNRMNSSEARLKNKHGGKTVYAYLCHTFFRLVPPDKYFTEHPEYFSLVDGKRTPKQLCLTNPEVLSIATETVRRWLRDDPQVNIVPVEQTDYDEYCQCEKCRALAEHEGSQAGPILHFVNQVADNIKDEFPDVAVETEAYRYSRKPPKHVWPRPNVIIRLASIECCFSHPLATCDSESSARFRDDIVGWSSICDHLYVWDYVTDFAHYLLPFPNLYSLQPNIKFFVDHNVRGILEQGNHSPPSDGKFWGGGEFAELRSYIIARCLWDPDCNWKEEMNEFLQAYYGPAAGPIRQYIDILHEKVRKDNIHLHIRTGPSAAYLTKDIINQADGLFDEAQAAVASNPILLLRVKKDRLPVEYVKISRHREFFPTWQEFGAAVEGFAQVTEDWDNVYVCETPTGGAAPIEPRIQQWREEVKNRKEMAQMGEDEVAMHPLPGAWKFAIDPDDIGVSEKWFADSFNDAHWAMASSDRGTGWDTQGFPGYTGFGWYRQSFELPADLQWRQFVYLYFGAVDEEAYPEWGAGLRA